MKQLRILFAVVLGALLTSCGSTWSGFSSGVDYFIGEWGKYMPADSYDHTYIDAWKSGTGGKALVLGEVGVGLVGGLTGKDVSSLKNRLHNASYNLTKNETFGKNDTNNWIGAFFTLGDEFIDEYNKLKFEDAVARLTDPNVSGYNEEEALMVDYIDFQNRKIVWKSHSDYIQDLMDYRKSKNDDWLSSKLPKVGGISIEDYNNLPPKERQAVDKKLLTYTGPKETPKDNTPSPIIEEPIAPTQPTQPVIDYSSLIEGIVISEYDINAFSLSKIQEETLDRIAEILNNDQTIELLISGHTCTIGSEMANYSVGLKRANEAKKYLVDKGIDGQRIKVESLGYSNPINGNSSETERKHNRRLTFKIQN